MGYAIKQGAIVGHQSLILLEKLWDTVWITGPRVFPLEGWGWWVYANPIRHLFIALSRRCQFFCTLRAYASGQGRLWRTKSSGKEMQVLAARSWMDVYLRAKGTNSDTSHFKTCSIAENEPYGPTWMQRRLGYVAPGGEPLFPDNFTSGKIGGKENVNHWWTSTFRRLRFLFLPPESHSQEQVPLGVLWCLPCY